MGIAAEYNPLLLQLRLKVPPGKTRLRPIFLRGTKGADSSSIEKPSAFSAYPNLRARFDIQSEKNLSGDTFVAWPYAFGFEPVINIRGWVADAGVTIESGAEKMTRVDYARLVKDFPSESLRLNLGSLFYPVTGFMAPLSLTGIELIRDPEMTGTRSQDTEGGGEFLVTEPSLVKVSLSGLVMRSFLLSPGRYRVQDFPFASSLNDVVFDIQGQGSPSSRVRRIVPFNALNLAPGSDRHHKRADRTGQTSLGTASHLEGVLLLLYINWDESG